MIMQSLSNLNLTHTNLINRILIKLNDIHIKYELHNFQDSNNLLVGLFTSLSKLNVKKFNSKLLSGVIDRFASHSLTKLETAAD